MRTEGRFALAVLLMLGVLVGTNRLFPPVVPEEDLLPDSVAVDTGAVATPPTNGAVTLPAPDVPDVPGPEVAPGVVQPAGAPAATVTVEGPLYSLDFSTLGARITSAKMVQFEDLNGEGLVDLVPEGSPGYMSQRIVVGSDTIDLSAVPFDVSHRDGLRLSEGSSAQTVTFTYEHPTADFSFALDYTFDPAAYAIGVTGRVRGVGDALLVTDIGEGLAYVEADSVEEERMMAYVYNHLQEGIESTVLGKSEPGIVAGPLLWAAFKSKFFVVALLAGESDEDATDATYLGGLLVRGSETEGRAGVSTAQSVGNDGSVSYRLFMGPQDYARLSSLGQGMEEVNPYGWRLFRPIIRPFVSIIMTILVFLHTQLTWSYGWVLVVFGVILRIVLFPLNHKAMKAQLRNMAVQPLVQEIQKKHKETPEKLQKEMMKLHKEHGFNPLAGCLPMLLPWPILIALFFVFQNTIELRGVEFLWLPDLSAKDPFYILPVMLAISMFLMQWVSLRSLDEPNQQMKMMMYIMPPMMLFIFANLASGLNVYYVATNIATIPQQVWIANERKKMKGKPPPTLSSD